MRITERKLRSIIRQVIVEQNERPESMPANHPYYEDAGNAIIEICDNVRKAIGFYKLKEKTKPEPGSVIQEDPHKYAHRMIDSAAVAQTMQYLFNLKNNKGPDLFEWVEYITYRVKAILKYELDTQIFRSGDAYDREQAALQALKGLGDDLKGLDQENLQLTRNLVSK